MKMFEFILFIVVIVISNLDFLYSVYVILVFKENVYRKYYSIIFYIYK